MAGKHAADSLPDGPNKFFRGRPKHRASEPHMERIVDEVPSGIAPRSAAEHVANREAQTELMHHTLKGYRP